jgi:hypothetical protein
MNYLLSFADSRLGGNLRNPRERLRRQAEAMGFFGDRIRIWTEADLDSDFREKMKSHLVHGSRGYGYWCWKPQIVLQLLREMDEGDILLYVDAGCHLNPGGIKRLKEYFELAEKYGIVAFQSRQIDDALRNDFSTHFLPDGEWCKGDILDYFGVRNDSTIVNSGQMGGGIFLVKKSAAAVRFFEEFRQVYFDRYELCDDSPSISPNLPGFIENRHDQSIFSLLVKRNGVYTLSSKEYDPMNGGDDWSPMERYPIWAKHDKGGIRSLFPNWFKRIVHKLTLNAI